MKGRLLLAAVVVAAVGCQKPSSSKPLAELTRQEASGQQVFVSQCSGCHYANSEDGMNGPGLEGLFRKPYLPSGTAAKDPRVASVIVHGRGMMPPFGNRLTEQELADLMAYLHTL